MKTPMRFFKMNIKKCFLSVAFMCAVLVMNSVAVYASTNKPANPSVTLDVDGTKYSVWDCIWFGSYPQTEIVETASDSGVYGKSWSETKDYKADSKLYKKLTNAADWDENGDITLDGMKYHRIQESDATYVSQLSSLYYDWGKAEGTYRYFRYDPIKWRVLRLSGTNVTLIADRVLDDKLFNMSSNDVTWANSTIRSWLNGYGSAENADGLDYSSGNFINSAFTSEEQAALVSTETESSTQDLVFLASSDDVGSSSYEFISNKARRCESSTYAKAMGTRTAIRSPYLGKCDWWLRSEPTDSGDVAEVRYDGTLFSEYGYDSNSDYIGVRPMIQVNLTNKSIWSNAGRTTDVGNLARFYNTYEIHFWDQGEVTTVATCVKTGIKTYTCLGCAETKTEEIPATGIHKEVTDKAVAATVFATGKTAGSHCSVCGQVLTAQETIAKLKPTVKLSAAKKTLKTKKSYTLVISKLAKGDSIKSVKSSKTSYVSVKKISTTKYKITAKKKGKAYVTVTLKSKKTAKCLVTVK